MTTKTKSQLNNWRTVRLGDVTDINMGQSPSSKTYNSRGEGLPFYQGVTDFGRKYPATSLYCSNPVKTARTSDILFSVRAPVGDVNVAMEEICLGRGVASLSMKDGYNDFLYFLLKNYTKHFKSVAGGTTYESINKNQIEDIEFPVPDSSEQKRIAGVLSAFDEKIENNNKIIRALEEMAQAIFKEWFVNFKFPGYEKVKMIDSELGKIPGGWSIGFLDAIATRLTSPKIYKESVLEKIGQIPVYDQSSKIIIGYHNEEPSFEASASKPIMIFGDHTCRTQLITEPFSIGPNVIPITGRFDYPVTFAYYLLRKMIVQKEYKRHWGELENKVLILPSVVLAKKFGEKEQLFIQKRVLCEKENKKLATTRDLLLPKLMSGEIRV